MNDSNGGGPIEQTLGLADVTLIVVGIVIGSGIFKLPGLVARSCGSGAEFMLLWLAGGVMSMAGALCYAELASAYPNAGGDYHFIGRAYGRGMSFMFAWARMSVIQTGSIAYLAFFIGDYLAGVRPLGAYSSSIYACAAIVLLTAINLLGIKQGKTAQALFTAAIVAGLSMVVSAGFAAAPAPAAAAPHAPSMGLGMAMVFILLAFGGWNESAYVSAEIREPGKNIVKSLVFGIAFVTIVYLLVNWSYLRVLGLEGMAESQNVGQEFIRLALGGEFVPLITLCVVFAVMSTANATIISGARNNYALGRDFKIFGFLGKWNTRNGSPAAALVLQCIVALGLVLIGNAINVNTGFETMVAYTTPVFWFFFLLAGLSVFILRKKNPDIKRVFSVPLYPLTPAVFCLGCLFMLKNGIDYILLLPKIGVYSGLGAALGIGVLLLGIPFYLADKRIRAAPGTCTTG